MGRTGVDRTGGERRTMAKQNKGIGNTTEDS